MSVAGPLQCQAFIVLFLNGPPCRKLSAHSGSGDTMKPFAGSFSIAFNNGGPVSLVWGWFWVAIMTMSVVRTDTSTPLTIASVREMICAGWLRCRP